MKTLRPVPPQCTGCRLCLLGCSFWHEDAFSEALARLQVRADETRWRFEPVVCRQCPDAPCLEACPVGAISRDGATGGLRLDGDACTGCGSCVAACRYQAILFNDDTNRVQLCDLCGGEPECVRACPHGAIVYAEDG